MAEGSEASVAGAGLLDDLTAALDRVFSAELESFSSAQIMELLQGWEQHRRREVAVEHLLVSVLQARGIAGEFGFSSPAALLSHTLRIDPGEAKARVRAAEDLAPRFGLSGERLEPIFSEAASAQLAGAISPRHAKVIISTLDGLRPELDCEYSAKIQSEMVAAARNFAPRDLAKLAARIVAHLDPDGAEPRDAEHQRHRSFALAKRADGMVVPAGALTPACGALLETVLDALSAPAPVDEGADGNLEPDRRTPGQRRHDALQDLATRALADGGLPGSGGVPTTLVLTMTEEQFRSGSGYAATQHGDLVSVPQALLLAEQAEVVTATLNTSGGVLDVGRTKRCATPTMRYALFARDRGCSFPGCTTPATWTEAHHVVPWRDGGATSVANMCLLCGFHHRSFERMEWEVFMRDGFPWWRPPAWIDRDRRPIRNDRHDVAESALILGSMPKERGDPPPTQPPV
ncbi:protein of unknown function [Frankineae bacterium MT45]|nr:protein of unknown function [Frankineae bacterium MT45]